MRKSLMVVMVFVILFTLAGCSKKVIIEDKTEDPGVSDEVDKAKEDKNQDGEASNEEETPDKGSVTTDIIMTADKDTYELGVKEINLTIDNKTANEYYYGVAFTLEQNVNGEWTLVSPIEDVFVIEIAYILEANGTATIVSDLVPYGELAEGQYRIVKEMVKQTTEEEAVTPENLKVTAEFNISSSK